MVCCKICLHLLQNGNLPPPSIFNNLQFGSTPSTLEYLSLQRKLLISFYRLKMHVTSLRSFAGQETKQSALKGNTINLPQDIAKIAESVPPRPDISVDHLNVVFIGYSTPSREMLKKIFTIRREKVYNTLRF